ncbi:acid phosphatase [Methylobacterium nonmethylotrophicum]|uniref:Acid phosphatase n=1 Tax=Methylobacterium nonmethylotrophicum TaxID=1141884 RepID=A0A4Z0NMH3_9HYPH|nr:phosphatase PAP2 family protein [Methylobacterium nonmethylotrophicum]TGD97128.1 phosphatase PAP2 family protein [Methylobacterium nonmethylotrophicum]
MRARLVVPALTLALAAAGASADPAREPYLAAGALDVAAALPAPPRPGSAAQAADAAIYAATRDLAGSSRWHLAVADVASGVPRLLDDFSCAIGRRLDPARVPALAELLARLRRDVVAVVRNAKARFARLRPHLGNDAPICVDRTEALDRSFAYPSGHATEGWTFGLVLAALMPERAAPILRRGRIYGESRIVCGVHWASDVEAGRSTGAALFAALVGSPAFRADLDRARAELAAGSEGAAPEAALCAREDQAAHPP